ncbi:hypothetical protein SIN_01334 [Salmonella enterica subsp. enterica serovar Infantis]|nr:hypothetical protein SIN_01334 [Salmonella enterica subsp. enterica serovar Infantis]
MISHCFKVFSRDAHSSCERTNNTIPILVYGVKFFATQNTLSKSLAELGDN